MYKEIEEIYKKKSPYNIIKKKIFLIYFIFIFISLIFNFFENIIFIILIFIAMIISMKKESEKVLKTKLHLSIGKKRDEEESLLLIIKNSENKLFKKYSIKNNIYNEKSLLCIIGHYRNLVRTKIVGGNLLAILSIIIPILLSFCTKDGFDFNSLAKTLPYLICFTIMIIILYLSYNQFIEAKKFFKGEDGMVERLEEIFSELYIDCINEFFCNKKLVEKNIKKQNKKTKNSKK